MEFRHDPDADALYVTFRTAAWDRTEQLDDARHVDYAADGQPIGVEVLGVSHGVDLAGLPREQELAGLLRANGVRLASAGQIEARILDALATDPEWGRLAFARSVGRAVGECRKRHGLGVRELGRRLGMAPSGIVRLEAGEHNPSIETLQRLARVLDLRFVVEVVPSGEVSVSANWAKA